MNIHAHRGAKVTGALGVVVILAHLTAAVAFGMVAAQWMSGVVMGFVLLVSALIHVARANHRKNSLH